MNSKFYLIDRLSVSWLPLGPDISSFLVRELCEGRYKCWQGTELGKTSCCPLPLALHCHWVKSWITKVGTDQIRHGVSHWPRGIVGIIIVSFVDIRPYDPPPLNTDPPHHLPARLVNLGIRYLSWFLNTWIKISNWLMSTCRYQRNKVTKLARNNKALSG